jgi:hypothetical protein
MRLGLQISSLSLSRDHGELRALPPGCVVTEKDAARLPPSADIWALRVEPKLTGEQALIDLISALLK